MNVNLPLQRNKLKSSQFNFLRCSYSKRTLFLFDITKLKMNTIFTPGPGKGPNPCLYPDPGPDAGHDPGTGPNTGPDPGPD